MRDTDNGGIKEEIDRENNIIISDSTLSSLLPSQFKKCCQDTRLCVVANVAYLPKIYIPHYYHGVIVVRKTQVSQPECSNQNVWGKSKFAYMKRIKIQSCHMGVIFMPKNMIWQGQKCVCIHS